MGYLIFRGVGTEGSASVVGANNVLSDVYVSKMPSHKKASMRYTEYYVKGRDGALHVDEGLASFTLTATLILMKCTANKRLIVNAWADGTGKLITSDDLTKCYRATVKEEVIWTRVQANGGFYDTADITFTCEPCMYDATDTPQIFTTTGTIFNGGTADAYPLIAIEGSGTVKVTIAGQQITINNMVANVPVYIDCENGYVYKASGAATITGDIPYLPMGQSNIVLGQNATKVTITPHWRYV